MTVVPDSTARLRSALNIDPLPGREAVRVGDEQKKPHARSAVGIFALWLQKVKLAFRTVMHT
jgi:hypothetical protein